MRSAFAVAIEVGCTHDLPAGSGRPANNSGIHCRPWLRRSCTRRQATRPACCHTRSALPSPLRSPVATMRQLGSPTTAGFMILSGRRRRAVHRPEGENPVVALPDNVSFPTRWRSRPCGLSVSPGQSDHHQVHRQSPSSNSVTDERMVTNRRLSKYKESRCDIVCHRDGVLSAGVVIGSRIGEEIECASDWLSVRVDFLRSWITLIAGGGEKSGVCRAVER